ncbi:MAG: cation:proton antiporter, partial [Clostridia bacterium]|nr:cation:proton antiporter [Clostridia bacterium]
MTLLLSISFAMLVGLMLSRLAKLVSLPAVTAYLVAGIIVGPFCIGALGIEGLGFATEESVKHLSVISTAALGFIAFSIGNEFRLSQLKKTGKAATFIGIFQAVAAALVVDIALIVLSLATGTLNVSTAVVLGAIATATAPAATLMVVRQYKAKGELTDLLLPIVAIDDAVGLVVFAISLGVARAIEHGTVDVISIIVNPLVEIIASLLLGSLMGVILTYIERFFHSRSKRMSMAIAFVFLTVALAELDFHFGSVHLGFSSLLVCMMMGTVFCNLSDISEDLMNRTDKWSAPIMALFFVLSGAELELSVFTDIAIVGIGAMYIASRSAGKYYGANLSCRLAGCDPTITKYLGITLLPQAGVALGMSATAASLPGDGLIIRNIVLFGVLIYELVGPSLTKMALTKSGDIVE